MTTTPAAEPQSKPASRGRKDAGKIREWARAQGLAVAEQGRLSVEVIRRYDAAHPPS